MGYIEEEKKSQRTNKGGFIKVERVGFVRCTNPLTGHGISKQTPMPFVSSPSTSYRAWLDRPGKMLDRRNIQNQDQVSETGKSSFEMSSLDYKLY